MTTTRRLAAILAADVAGYSAAMERDEEGTAAAVRALRREVIEPNLAEHHGRLIKTTGDGFLAEFASPIAALKCALAIQQRPDESGGLRLRIGLNLGDVIIEEGGDLLGEGVNVAARLEGLAEPGGILISSKIYSEVEGKVEASFEDRGEQQVKNITRPVRAYAVRVGALASAAIAETRPLPLPDKPSIAVLPFQNMSGDPEQDYFADGMVEEIITALSRFKSLFVIARNSSFAYKGKTIEIKQVGRELGVRYVLEGSVRKAGGRVRITGQLIEAATNNHLWADKFEGTLDGLFDLQDQVTSQIVGIITPTVQTAEIERARAKRPDSLEAYDHLLRAQHIHRLQYIDEKGHADALAHANSAIALLPEHALPYAVASACYAQRYVAGMTTDFENDSRLGRELAHRALALDPDDPGILHAVALAIANFEDMATSSRMLERAVATNPNLAGGWALLGWTNINIGNHDRALECLGRAYRLIPTGPGVASILAGHSMACFLLDKDADAYDWAERAYAANPRHVLTLRTLAVSAAQVGKQERARLAFSSMAKTYARQLARMKMTMKRPQDYEKIRAAFALAAARDYED